MTLLRATVEAVQENEQTAAKLRSAWEKLGVKDETEQARLLADAVNATRDDVTAIRQAAGRGNRRYLMAAVLATGLVLVISGLASSGTLAQSLSRVLTGTGLAALLAAAVTFATLTKRVADGARSVADSRTRSGNERKPGRTSKSGPRLIR